MGQRRARDGGVYRHFLSTARYLADENLSRIPPNLLFVLFRVLPFLLALYVIDPSRPEQTFTSGKLFASQYSEFETVDQLEIETKKGIT
jgi:hypothetical protein